MYMTEFTKYISLVLFASAEATASPRYKADEALRPLDKKGHSHLLYKFLLQQTLEAASGLHHQNHIWRHTLSMFHVVGEIVKCLLTSLASDAVGSLPVFGS